MVDNLSNVKLVANEATDIYDKTGIATGTQIEVQNIGCADVILYSQLTEPSINEGQQIIKRGEYMENEESDSGAWATSPHQDGLLNVKVAR